MTLNIFAALNDKNVIRNDLEIAKSRLGELVKNHTLITDRTTENLLPKEILKLVNKRIIISDDSNGSIADIVASTFGGDSFLIGNSKTYESFLPLVKNMEILWVKGDESEGDKFPNVGWEDWNSSELGKAGKNYDGNGLNYHFISYHRNGNSH